MKKNLATVWWNNKTAVVALKEVRTVKDPNKSRIEKTMKSTVDLIGSP